MKNTYILTESQIQNLIDVVLKEQTEKIYTDFDRVWDYKFVNNQWFAKRKSGDKWLSLKNYPKAIEILNKKYNPTETPTTPVAPTTKPTTPATPTTPTTKPTAPAIEQQPTKPQLGAVPFKNNEEGNRFRQWFINTYPDKAREINLSATGPFNNSYITKAFNTKLNNNQTVGEYYNTVTSDSLYQFTSQNYRDKIIFDKLSSTDTVNVCDISDETTNCAQFVNNFSDKINVVGNAWEAYENGEVGKPIFSVFRNLTDEQIKKYYSIYNYINKGGEDPKALISLEESLIKQAGQPTDLQEGDIVGIYYMPSKHHIEAFKDSSVYRNWYPDGKPGKTMTEKRIGHTFNTHVGIVGAIKDGVPLIFHNISGTVKSDPPKNLKITWVKRP